MTALGFHVTDISPSLLTRSSPSLLSPIPSSSPIPLYTLALLNLNPPVTGGAYRFSQPLTSFTFSSREQKHRKRAPDNVAIPNPRPFRPMTSTSVSETVASHRPATRAVTPTAYRPTSPPSGYETPGDCRRRSPWQALVPRVPQRSNGGFVRPQQQHCADQAETFERGQMIARRTRRIA